MSVTSVTLGNFYTTNDGKTVLGGSGGSGLDTKTLVTGLVEAKSLPITQDQAAIKANTDESTALNTFQTLVSTFQSAADALRNPPGINNTANNVFAFTVGTVGNGGSAYVSVASEPGAATQSYNVSDITSVATAATQTSGIFNIDSANDDATTGAVSFAPGVITFASGATVTITEGDSLNNIAANFNAVSSSSGISASILQIDASHFTLSFAATKTGTDANFDLRDSGTVPSGSGVLASVGLSVPVDGANAEFKVNGVSIERQSNSVSDVVSGVTFNILQQSPAATNYSVSISPDTITIQNTIVRFVNAYNALKSFSAEQTQQKDDGTYASTAVLAKNLTFRQTMSTITNQILAPGTGLSGAITSLSDVGITLINQPATDTLPAVSDVLNVNDNKLTTLLNTKFEDVKKLFGFNLTTDNSNLALFKETKPLGVQNFTVTIAGSPGEQTFTASYILNGSTISVPLASQAIGSSLGFSLTGPSGSALEGLQLIYASNANATINVSTSQGVADKIYNTANAATNSKTGAIALGLKALQDRTDTLNEDISRITIQVSQYQTQLLAKFSALEAAVSKVNTLLQSLSANANAQLTSSGN